MDYLDRLDRFRKILSLTVNRAKTITASEKQPGFVAAIRHTHMKEWGQQMLDLMHVACKVQGTPVTDQPVSREMGSRKTGSENIAPIAMQPSRPPAATMTQR